MGSSNRLEILCTTMADLSQLATPRAGRYEIAIWATKLVLLSGGIVSIVLLFKMAMVPYMIFLIKSTLPCLRCWLSPPYIYIIFNVIILAVVASSTSKQDTHPNKDKPTSIPKLAFDVDNDALVTKSHDTDQSHYTLRATTQGDSSASCLENFVNPTLDSSSSPKSWTDSFTRRVEENISEEETLTPSEDSETNLANDTLEDAWKIIMEGQEKKAPKRQLKKSDTWETSPQVLLPKFTDRVLCREEDDPMTTARREFRKSDTFNERLSLRSDDSMIPDDLNKRAEAFIRKFTYEMRLQGHELPKQDAAKMADMTVNQF